MTAARTGGDVADTSAPRMSPGVLIAGRYRLEKRLGAGAMGEVWRARHEELNTDLAVKLALMDGANDDVLLERFRLEAQLSAQLSRHTEHIVAVHDAGRHHGTPFMVMEYVPGKSLEERIESAGTLPVERVAQVLDQVARALTVAHDHGIWHRDIKSANIMIAERDDGPWLVKLADFGVAKTIDHKLDLDAPKTTMAGALVGTPGYMSPEQVGGDPPSAASDLWSLAVTAYEALSGRLPFDAETASGMLRAILASPHEPLGELIATTPAIDAWFERALSKNAAHRFPNAETLARTFRDATEVEVAVIAPPRRWPWVALAAVAASGGAAAALWPPEAPAAKADVPRTLADPFPLRATEDPRPHVSSAPTAPDAVSSEPSPSSPIPRVSPRPAAKPTVVVPIPRKPKPYDPDETQ